MTGYQQAILYLLGCCSDDRFVVRCVDRWYVDQVADLFPTRPYLQRRTKEGKKDYYTIKSCRRSYDVQLSDVADVVGFCRGVVELQGTFALWTHRSHGKASTSPRLRLYGAPELLSFVMAAIPAAPKKMQHSTPIQAAPMRSTSRAARRYPIFLLISMESRATHRSGIGGMSCSSA